MAAAAGGGGEPSRPQARATASAESVVVGTPVTLDGSGSSTSGAGTLTYQWTLLEAPEGSTAALADATSATASLTPARSGAYIVSLVVNDGTASSDPVRVTVTATEPPRPVAIIASANGIETNRDYQLDGSGSQPPAGGDASRLRYEWVLFEQPAGSTASLDNPTLAQPRFKPAIAGDYKVRLTVRYDDMVSEPAERTISAQSLALPKAVITDKTSSPTRGQPVELDGSTSTHPDGKPLSYFWRYGSTSGQPWTSTGRPTGSATTLQNVNAATVSFTPDRAGSYSLQLMVWNGKDVAYAGKSVAVAKPAGQPNVKPVAVISTGAGGQSTYTFEAEPGTVANRDEVILSSATSYDFDNDTLSPEWEWVSYPQGFAPATQSTLPATGSRQSFLPTVRGQYTMRLRVHDGTEWSDWTEQTYTVLTGANKMPVAVVKTSVGAQQSSSAGGSAFLKATTMVGQTVTLDGSKSTDGNGDELSYHWEMLHRPPGSAAVLDTARAAFPRFTADKEGPYLVRLQVQDSHGVLSRNYGEMVVVAKTFNSPPVLRPVLVSRVNDSTLISEEQPILVDKDALPYASYTISPNALDPDGEPVDVMAALVSGPAGVELPTPREWTATGGGSFDYSVVSFLPDGSPTFFKPTASGTYTFQVIGGDGMDESAVHVMKVPVAVTKAEYPSLLLRWTEGHLVTPEKPFEQLPVREHLLFPVKKDSVSPWPYSRMWYVRPGTDVGEMLQYALTAPADKDYTIIDVKAVSEDPLVPVSFVGLTEGQVISRGTTVLFQLGVKRFPEDRTEASPATPYPKATWSFKVKEKPEWTFEISDTLSGKWSR